MKAFDWNIEQLQTVALALGDVLPKVTFVGGCTTALLVDEAALFGVRQTDDVDVIVDVATYWDYQKLAANLKTLGFVEDIDGPTCRWLFRTTSGVIRLDVMPISEEVLGFSNHWYPEAIANSFTKLLDNGVSISIVAPVYFLATKFEAFNGRGNGDYYSHDLEDIVFVLENRSNILREVLDAASDLKQYLAEQCHQLLNDRFLNILPGILNDPNAAKGVENALRIIAEQK